MGIFNLTEKFLRNKLFFNFQISLKTEKCMVIFLNHRQLREMNQYGIDR